METAGRKLKYSEETQVISFRVPVSKAKEVNKIVRDYLDSIENDIDYDCGCSIKGGIFFRGKTGCKKTKQQHK